MGVPYSYEMWGRILLGNQRSYECWGRGDSYGQKLRVSQSEKKSGPGRAELDTSPSTTPLIRFHSKTGRYVSLYYNA